MRAFIVGGSGQLGRAIGELLLHDGWEVTCGQRGEPLAHLVKLGAKSVELDRSQPGALRSVVGGGCDLLVDTVAFDEHHAEQLLELDDVVGQFAVISSASVYCDDRGRSLDEAKGVHDFPQMPVGIRETQPTVAPGPATYSTKKAALERRMLESSRVPAAMIRPCAIYGPNSKHPREWWFVKRSLDERRQIALKHPDTAFQTSATPNVAEVVRVAAKAAFHGVLNAGDPHAPTLREIGAVIADALSWDCDFINVPAGVEGIGETPWSVPRSFVVSMDSAIALGYTPRTNYGAYAPEACRWLIDAAEGRDWTEIFPVLRYYSDMFDYEKEDAFFAQLQIGQAQVTVP